MSLYLGNVKIANAGGGYGGRPLDYQNAILSTYTISGGAGATSTNTITVQKDGILISDIQSASSGYVNGIITNQIEWSILNEDNKPVVKWINYMLIDSSTGRYHNQVQILDHVLYVKAGQVLNISFRKFTTATATVVFKNIPYLEE